MIVNEAYYSVSSLRASLLFSDLRILPGKSSFGAGSTGQMTGRLQHALHEEQHTGIIKE